MNGMKSVFVCMLIVAFGNVFISAHAKAPKVAASSNAAPVADKVDAEKSLLKGSIQPTAPDAAAAELCQCVDQEESGSTKKIEQALAGPLHSNGLDVADMPLNHVLTQLQDEYQIPIQLDGRALDDAGVGTDSPVTRSLHHISLRSALKLTLEPLQLTWIIRDEVLMITTCEAADRRLVTCVYNVQGLVDDKDPKSLEALTGAIKTCVSPESWSDHAGKQADIRPLKPGLLVISQTPANQEEVNGLLAKIRKVREQVPITDSRQRTPERAANRSSSSRPASPQKPADHRENAASENPFGD
jgi:hypothetical protein